jgi:hypothetical protein
MKFVDLLDILRAQGYGREPKSPHGTSQSLDPS